MKLLLINAVCGIRSTGRICVDIAQNYEKKGYEVKIAYGRENVPEQYQKYAIKIGNKFDVYWHAFMSKVFDRRGYYSKKATRKFLKWADHYDPDEIWLHNLHDYYINVEMLFSWIKSRPNMKVKWTQHDCWAFTGGCMHFSNSGCKGWTQKCEECIRKTSKRFLPIIHHNREMLADKKRWYGKLENVEIITPSRWLADLVKQSFLKEYPVKVINNKIDEDVFKPTENNFRQNNNLENKKIILGVASAWSEKKGLYDFYKVADAISEDYCVVMVGLKKKQLRKLPPKILGIERTNNITELAEIYSAADVFFNPTYEDTYPTVNLEAEACGTKVITYDVGGCKETIHRNDSLAIPVGSWNQLEKYINTHID